MTSLSGRPVGSMTNVLTVGARGPMLLEDTTWFEEMAHFNRERIPERVVRIVQNKKFSFLKRYQNRCTPKAPVLRAILR